MAIACVTGATSGIGRAFCEELAARGFDVILVARDEARLAEVSDLLTARGVMTEILPADLAADEGCARVMDRLRRTEQPVSVLVNNAGFGLGLPFLRSSLADEDRLLDVLVRACMRLTHAALPGMVDRGEGHVVNVSSVAGWTPLGTYSAAKAWTTVFTEGLAAQLRGTGVTATAVCPGFTHTEFHARADIAKEPIPSWAWLDAGAVAREGLSDALSGSTVSIPSKRYTALAWMLQTMPRPLLRRALTTRVNPRRPVSPGQVRGGVGQ